jgi:hypothetical protein
MTETPKTFTIRRPTFEWRRDGKYGRMKTPFYSDSLWEDEDGTWTIAHSVPYLRTREVECGFPFRKSAMLYLENLYYYDLEVALIRHPGEVDLTHQIRDQIGRIIDRFIYNYGDLL